MSKNFRSSTLCRSFTLFNNKILSDYYVGDDNYVPMKSQYLAIGFFDGFNTEIVIKNKDTVDEKTIGEDTVDKNVSKNNFKALYEHIQKLSDKLNGEQSYQNVYGFINESKSERENTGKFACSDKQFWEENDNHLIFVSFWQIGNVKFGETITRIKSILNEKKYNKSEIPFIVYSTLDKSDFIICFKSNTYKDVTLLINELYIQLQILNIQTIYSYTNLIVNNYLKNKEFTSEEKIDSICIKTVLNNFSGVEIELKIKAFCNKLSEFFYGKDNGEVKQKEKNIVGYEILGDTDCRFIARNVSLVKIVELFSDTGLLNINNNDFKYCFLSSMTSLNVDCSKNIVDMNKYEEQVTSYISTKGIKPKKASKVANLQQKVNKINNSKYYNVKTSLVNLLHCLRSMELSINQKYEFEILFSPVETAIELLMDVINDEKKEKTRYVGELLNYIDKIYIIIQGALRTDIRLYQILDYSVMSYYAPSKLRIFYSLFIKNMSKYYEQLCPSDNHKYEFIIFHSTNIDITVEQVWRNHINENKVMTVNIPECKLYDIKTAIFTLAHEVAHFVGNEEIRKRDDRFNAIVKTMAKRHYKNCCFEILKVLKEFTNDDKINEKFKEFVSNVVEHRITFLEVISKQEEKILNEFNEAINELSKDEFEVNVDKYFMYYSVKIFEVFETAYTKKYTDLIRTPLLDSINNKLHKIISNTSDSTLKDFKLYSKFMEKCKDNIISKLEDFGYEEIYFKDSFLEDILYMVAESYADLSAIILLNLKVEEYFYFIGEIIEQEFSGVLSKKKTADELFDILRDERIFVRCCIVITALSEATKEAFKAEKDNSKNKKNYNIKHSETFNSFISTLSSDKKYDNNGVLECFVLKFVKDGYIDDWEYICDYLKECAISFGDESSDISEKIRNKIIKIYKDTTSNDLLTCVNAINNFINEKTEEDNEKDNY